MMSPCQRSLKKLRAEGWFCAITEHWNPFARRRIDLFGFADLICLKGNETLAVQTTSGDHVAERVAKIKAATGAVIWLSAPTRKIVVHGWRRIGARGKLKTWACREVEVTTLVEVSSQ